MGDAQNENSVSDFNDSNVLLDPQGGSVDNSGQWGARYDAIPVNQPSHKVKACQ